MLGNMEKLAGDLAYHHLKRCATNFKLIVIYGLLLTYKGYSSTAYRLEMDFANNMSTLFEERQERDVRNGIELLLGQLKHSNEKSV